MVDALAIARMSQSVIQRAITIALRLKSIAAGAIATGDVDRRALAETMSEIRAALGEEGARPSPAVSAPPSSRGTVRPADLGEELGLLGDAASGLARGGTAPRLDTIDGALRKLEGKNNSYMGLEIDIMGGVTKNPMTGPGGMRSAADLASRTGSDLSSDPVTALKSQGNLTAATVRRLTT